MKPANKFKSIYKLFFTAAIISSFFACNSAGDEGAAADTSAPVMTNPEPATTTGDTTTIDTIKTQQLPPAQRPKPTPPAQ